MLSLKDKLTNKPFSAAPSKRVPLACLATLIKPVPVETSAALVMETNGTSESTFMYLTELASLICPPTLANARSRYSP